MGNPGEQASPLRRLRSATTAKPAKFSSKIASSVQGANLRLGGFCTMFAQRVSISGVLLVAVCSFLARAADGQVKPVQIVVPRVEVQRPVAIPVPRVQVPSASVQPVQPTTLPPVAPNGQLY